MDPDYYFSTVQTRTVKADHTLAFANQTLQLQPNTRGPSLVGQQVEVHQLPEGTLKVYHNRTCIAHKKLPAPPAKTNPAPTKKPAEAMDPEGKRASRRRQMAHLHTSTT